MRIEATWPGGTVAGTAAGGDAGRPGRAGGRAGGDGAGIAPRASSRPPCAPVSSAGLRQRSAPSAIARPIACVASAQTTSVAVTSTGGAEQRAASRQRTTPSSTSISSITRVVRRTGPTRSRAPGSGPGTVVSVRIESMGPRTPGPAVTGSGIGAATSAPRPSSPRIGAGGHAAMAAG